MPPLSSAAGVPSVVRAIVGGGGRHHRRRRHRHRSSHIARAIAGRPVIVLRTPALSSSEEESSADPSSPVSPSSDAGCPPSSAATPVSTVVVRVGDSSSPKPWPSTITPMHHGGNGENDPTCGRVHQLRLQGSLGWSSSHCSCRRALPADRLSRRRVGGRRSETCPTTAGTKPLETTDHEGVVLSGCR